MRLRAILLSSLLAVFVSTAYGQAPPQRPSVMVLGTYHMGNPGLDILNAQSDDPRSEKRQKELAELATMLAKFRPTKIVVEAAYGSTKIDEQYRGYLAGTFELPANELHQIGFRLAKNLGHARVYSADWQGKFEFDAVMASAAKNGQTAVIERAMAEAKGFVDELNARIKRDSIAGILRWMNEDERVDSAERLYLALARIGTGEDYAGADLVADWHERNLKIFTNVMRIADSPADRVLVIYGSGHAKLLTEFAEDSGAFTVERPSAYLK